MGLDNLMKALTSLQMKIILFTAIMVLGFAKVIFAAPATQQPTGTSVPAGLSIQDLQSPAEQEITQRARNRTYAGGKDEEPLKIQTKLVPTSTEEEGDPANSEAASED